MEKRFVEMPRDVLVYTLSFLDLSSLFNFSLTCNKGSLLFKEESLWRLLCLRDIEEEERKGGESWQDKYKSSLFKWEAAEAKYSLSQRGKKVSSDKKLTQLGKMSKPLSKNKIHKCESPHLVI